MVINESERRDSNLNFSLFNIFISFLKLDNKLIYLETRRDVKDDVKMTYAPRVHFRVLIWDDLFVFFEANFCFLVTCSFLYCFQSVVKICARKGYVILTMQVYFLMN